MTEQLPTPFYLVITDFDRGMFAVGQCGLGCELDRSSARG
jgi:hypothetical protein